MNAVLNVILAGSLLASVGCGSAAERHQDNSETANMEQESQLLGVRFVGPPETLSKIEKVAAGAGWTEIRRDQPGSILAVSPKPYRFEEFTRLIDAVNGVSPHDFSLQLIGPDGKPVNLGPPEDNG